jgi:hypothetical protein
MGAQQTFRGIVSIIGPIAATAAYDGLGTGVPFYLAAAAVATASVLIAREPRGGGATAAVPAEGS